MYMTKTLRYLATYHEFCFNKALILLTAGQILYPANLLNSAINKQALHSLHYGRWLQHNSL